MARAMVFVAFLLLSVTAGDVRVSAQSPDDERARTHFQSGRLYFEEGAYERALLEFETAYRLSPRPVMLLNLANTNERLGRPGAAAQHLRDYLAQVPAAADRETIERRIENLSAQDAQMRAADEESRRQLEEERARLAAEQAAREAAPAERAPRRNLTVPLIAYGAGAAGVLMFAIAGPIANAKESDLASGCGATRTCTHDQVAPADRLAAIADVGLGLAIAGAAAGTVLLFVGPGAPRDAEPASPTVSVAPILDRSTFGIASSVRF